MKNKKQLVIRLIHIGILVLILLSCAIQIIAAMCGHTTFVSKYIPFMEMCALTASIGCAYCIVRTIGIWQDDDAISVGGFIAFFICGIGDLFYEYINHDHAVPLIVALLGVFYAAFIARQERKDYLQKNARNTIKAGLWQTSLSHSTSMMVLFYIDKTPQTSIDLSANRTKIKI